MYIVHLLGFSDLLKGFDMNIQIYIYIYVILSVPKFTANLYCICLSIDLRYILGHSVYTKINVLLMCLTGIRLSFLTNEWLREKISFNSQF